MCLPKEQAARVIKAIEGCRDQHFKDNVPAGTSDEPLRLERDDAIAMVAAKRIFCDAGVVPITEDNEGNVLNVGRKTRVISPARRRALNKRDEHTCLPRYGADRMDYDLALDALVKIGV